ncbi:unnamed protein product [Ambrosiozyma monospora]|uniref:Unnamed protein product n=1 Tax=Ambrosiozyma monospora TaxID=43982 RepID=A0ACB5T9D6_AMBMO|nr:unnamed protein product [Ambrosiozyma monospora]
MISHSSASCNLARLHLTDTDTSSGPPPPLPPPPPKQLLQNLKPIKYRYPVTYDHDTLLSLAQELNQNQHNTGALGHHSHSRNSSFQHYPLQKHTIKLGTRSIYDELPSTPPPRAKTETSMDSIDRITAMSPLSPKSPLLFPSTSGATPMLKITSPVVSPSHVAVNNTTSTTKSSLLLPLDDLTLSPSPTSKKHNDLKKLKPLEINTKPKKPSMGGSLSASLELTPKKRRESSSSSVLSPKSKSPKGHQKSSSFSSFTSSMSKLISTVTPTSPIKHKRSKSAIALGGLGGGALSSASTTSSTSTNSRSSFSSSSHIEFKLKSHHHHHHHHTHSRSTSASAIRQLNHARTPSTASTKSLQLKKAHARSASTASGKSFSISPSSTTASTSSASTPIKKTQSRNLSTSSASTSGSSPMSPYSPDSSLFTSSEDERSSPASSLNEETTCDDLDSPSPIDLHPEPETDSESVSVSYTEPEYESKPLLLSSEVKSIVDNLPEGLTHSMSKFDGKQYPEFWQLTQENCRTLAQWNELEFKKQGKIFEFFLLLKRIRFNTKRMVNHYGPGLMKGNSKLSSKQLKACKLAFDSLGEFNADLKKLVVFQLKPCYDYTFFVNDYQVLKIALSWFGELAGSCPPSSALTFKSKSFIQTFKT